MAELQAASPAHCYAGPGDVECDFCIGRKRKATNSCLVCLASYCEVHLKPHYQSPAFKKHKLVEACAELQEKICSEHHKLIDIYCHTDQSFICYLCMIDEHKDHNTVSTKAERTQKQIELKEEQKKFQVKMQNKSQKVQQVKQTMDSIKSFPSLCVSPGCDDSPSFTVNQHLSFNGVRKSLSDLKKRVEEICEEEFNITHPQAAAVQMVLPSEPKSREDFLQYFCDLTLDPNTAHHHLILSEKNRAVTRNRTDQRYSDHPERFDFYAQVLCKESVSGRCYWEVEWNGMGVDILVSYKGISRKGEGNESGFGLNKQSWSLQCYPSSVCFWRKNIKTELQAPASSRIGVYVDHIAGKLSFYNVSDTMKLIHSIKTKFTQLLYPGFRICYYHSTMRLCDPDSKPKLEKS
ncbi:tripartite motif-containing protein 16-like isoform X2 [Neoarius graeffei]|uniref:tripartite motif-containing protein 16-like isoform X2 n=1 Tax=Neoarius graeffei TaxID=443677 RepID=UPI00298CA1C2|nr:tripartite motif-containing protein 16-like isoform X2 [Neoarius graeffei]